MIVNETTKKVVEQLYDWQHGGTSFSSLLFTLFRKADPDNYHRLSSVYPVHATVLVMWDAAGNCGDDLFREYGLIKDDEGTKDGK